MERKNFPDKSEKKTNRERIDFWRTFTLLIFFAFFSAISSFIPFGPFSSTALGQAPWKMFADQIKQEAAAKKTAKKAGIPFPSSENNQQDVSSPESEGKKNAEPSETTPPEGDPSETLPTVLSNNGAKRRSERPERENRVFDFSEGLGEDASDEFAVIGPDREESPIGKTDFPPLPSYRNASRMKNDATLRDVFFPTAGVGWAVGDRGTIWTTSDGGANWLLVDSPVDCNLWGVHFLTPNFGIIVGGEILPDGRNGRGTILRTEDGGAHWEVIPIASFPILRDVQILDSNRILAAGDSSELYPGGIFLSADSGRTWTHREGVGRHEGWKRLLADTAENRDVGVTSAGNIQTLTGNVIRRAAISDQSDRFADLSQVMAGYPLWTVGERGFIRASEDGGANWRRSAGSLPNGASDWFDFETVFAAGDNVWLAGTPGSLVFSTKDGGQTWSGSPTGVSVPLRRLRFSDPLHGWGVGDLGTIVATADGGQTWTVQHEGGRRLAYLALSTGGESFPLGIFPRLSGEEGYLGGGVLLTRSEERENDAAEISWRNRLEEAVVEATGSGLTQSPNFRLPPTASSWSRESILQQFDRENDGRGLERFRERLVRLIRVWRPNVLVVNDPTIEIPPKTNVLAENAPIPAKGVEKTGGIRLASFETPADNASAPIRPVAANGSGTSRINPIRLAMMADHARHLDESSQDPLRKLLESELPRAIAAAADPLVFPEHLSAAGLSVWRVDKVQRVLPSGGQGNITFSANDYCPSLGRSVGEIASAARRLAENRADEMNSRENRSDSGKTLGLVTLYDRAAGETKFSDFFAGIDLAFGSEARRFSTSGSELPEVLERLRERAGQRREALGLVKALSRRADAGSQGPEILLASLMEELPVMDPDLAVEYLLDVGGNFARDGKWTLAEEVFSIIPRYYSDHPRCREAIRWLIQYYAGSEPYWRTQDDNRFRESTTRIDPTGSGEAIPGNRCDEGEKTGSASRLAIDPALTGSRFHNADALGKMIRSLYPELYMDPEIRFPLAVVQRRRGYDKNALGYYLNRSLLMKDDLWGARAKGEYWLLAPPREETSPEEKLCPLSVCSAISTARRPFLDGKLEPDIWDRAAKFSLSEKRQRVPAEIASAAEKRSQERSAELEKLSTEFGTFVSILYDRDYLYLGIECRKAEGFAYPPEESSEGGTSGGGKSEAIRSSGEKKGKIPPPRQRDTDLTNQDRVELELDLDRDYSTSYRFLFDHRGWVNDYCWGRSDWNAPMFIARTGDANRWTLEIAIPWESLTEYPPTANDVWAIAVRRLIPNLGMECWNVDRSAGGEHGFGFLTFNR